MERTDDPWPGRPRGGCVVEKHLGLQGYKCVLIVLFLFVERLDLRSLRNLQREDADLDPFCQQLRQL
jgi:hypothetical protein